MVAGAQRVENLTHQDQLLFGAVSATADSPKLRPVRGTGGNRVESNLGTNPFTFGKRVPEDDHPPAVLSGEDPTVEVMECPSVLVRPEDVGSTRRVDEGGTDVWHEPPTQLGVGLVADCMVELRGNQPEDEFAAKEAG
jgi:hypothetical protein